MKATASIVFVVFCIVVGFLAGVVEEFLPSHLIEEEHNRDDNDVSSLEPKTVRREHGMLNAIDDVRNSFCSVMTSRAVPLNGILTKSLFAISPQSPSVSSVRD